MKTVLAIWCIAIIGLATFKLYEAYQLDKSWQKYADEWVQAHEEAGK